MDSALNRTWYFKEVLFVIILRKFTAWQDWRWEQDTTIFLFPGYFSLKKNEILNWSVCFQHNTLYWPGIMTLERAYCKHHNYNVQSPIAAQPFRQPWDNCSVEYMNTDDAIQSKKMLFWNDINCISTAHFLCRPSIIILIQIQTPLIWTSQISVAHHDHVFCWTIALI